MRYILPLHKVTFFSPASGPNTCVVIQGNVPCHPRRNSLLVCMNPYKTITMSLFHMHSGAGACPTVYVCLHVYFCIHLFSGFV